MLIFSLGSPGGGRPDRSGMDGDDLLNMMTWLIWTWLTNQTLLLKILRKTGTRSSRKQSKFYCKFTPSFLYSLSLSLLRINFAQRHTQIDQVDANGDTYEFEFFDPKWTRSADKITFLPATRRRRGEQRREKSKAKEPSLVWALVRTFWRTFVFAGMLKFFQDLLNFVSPQLLKYIFYVWECSTVHVYVAYYMSM